MTHLEELNQNPKLPFNAFAQIQSSINVYVSRVYVCVLKQRLENLKARVLYVAWNYATDNAAERWYSR